MSEDLKEKARLLTIREHLGVRARIHDPDFEREVLNHSMARIDALLGDQSFDTGEAVRSHLAERLRVKFEEVRSLDDVDRIKHKYLAKQEIGFGQLPLELQDPAVDAVLFKRMNAKASDTDQFVAVLNLMESGQRGYYSGYHEIAHRVAEPPQQELRFRHRGNQKNRVEHLVDLIAGRAAFHNRFFAPIVTAHAKSVLTWDVVTTIRDTFAPTSSREAAAKAIVNVWPKPAYYLKAALARRKGMPAEEPQLRISINGYNQAARDFGVYFIQNMRVPANSVAHVAFQLGVTLEDFENLSNWKTSSGHELPHIRAFTSSVCVGDTVHILVSCE